MALLTRRAWFGPKKIHGWGLIPNNKYGVFTMNLFVLGMVMGVGLLTFGVVPVGLIIAGTTFTLFIVVLACTSDPPGGPGMS